MAEETLDHMFFSCPVSKSFWLDIKNWLSLKIEDIPSFEISQSFFYMDNLNSSASDIINIIILIGLLMILSYIFILAK